MTIRLEFNRIAPGVEIGPHRHGVETIVYLAGGELVFEHGEGMRRRAVVRSGDVLYEAPSEFHRVRNEGSADALALLAAVSEDPTAPAGRGAPPLARRRTSPSAAGADGSWSATGSGAGSSSSPGDFGSVTFTVRGRGRARGVDRRGTGTPSAEHALVVFEGRGSIEVGEVEETLEPLKGIGSCPAGRTG